MSFRLISDWSGFTQQDSSFIWNSVIDVLWVSALPVNELKSEWSKSSRAAMVNWLFEKWVGNGIPVSLPLEIASFVRFFYEALFPYNFYTSQSD